MVIFPFRSCPAHAWTPATPPPAGGCDVSVEQLWGDYLAIGGSMSITSFLRCLDGVQFAEAAEHDVMAQALNEHLLDHGDRFPIPYLRQRVINETGPTAQLPLRWVAGHRASAAERRPQPR